MTLAEIKRRLRVGQQFMVVNHRLPDLSPVRAVVDRKTGDYGFYVKHALGESKVTWPPAAHVTRDEDGTLHLLGTGQYTGEPFLTLVPITAEAGRG